MTSLTEALTLYAHARPGDRSALVPLVRTRIGLAIAERSRLDRKLMAQWNWFAANPNHPETETKTDIFLRTLARYEQVVDAIVRANRRLEAS